MPISPQDQRIEQGDFSRKKVKDGSKAGNGKYSSTTPGTSPKICRNAARQLVMLAVLSYVIESSYGSESTPDTEKEEYVWGETKPSQCILPETQKVKTDVQHQSWNSKDLTKLATDFGLKISDQKDRFSIFSLINGAKFDESLSPLNGDNSLLFRAVFLEEFKILDGILNYVKDQRGEAAISEILTRPNLKGDTILSSATHIAADSDAIMILLNYASESTMKRILEINKKRNPINPCLISELLLSGNYVAVKKILTLVPSASIEKIPEMYSRSYNKESAFFLMAMFYKASPEDQPKFFGTYSDPLKPPYQIERGEIPTSGKLPLIVDMNGRKSVLAPKINLIKTSDTTTLDNAIKLADAQKIDRIITTATSDFKDGISHDVIVYLTKNRARENKWALTFIDSNARYPYGSENSQDTRTVRRILPYFRDYNEAEESEKVYRIIPNYSDESHPYGSCERVCVADGALLLAGIHPNEIQTRITQSEQSGRAPILTISQSIAPSANAILSNNLKLTRDEVKQGKAGKKPSSVLKAGKTDALNKKGASKSTI